MDLQFRSVFFSSSFAIALTYSQKEQEHAARPRTTLAGSTRRAPEAGQPFKPHSLAARLPRRPLRDPNLPNQGPTRDRQPHGCFCVFPQFPCFVLKLFILKQLDFCNHYRNQETDVGTTEPFL